MEWDDGQEAIKGGGRGRMIPEGDKQSSWQDKARQGKTKQDTHGKMRLCLSLSDFCCLFFIFTFPCNLHGTARANKNTATTKANFLSNAMVEGGWW